MIIGYARCSTDKQDLTAQREALTALGCEKIFLDFAEHGDRRDRPELEKALTTARAEDTIVVTKLDRLARSILDARSIADTLVADGVKLSINGSVYDPKDPMSKLFFNILALFAEFELDVIRMRTREGMAIARAKGKLKGRAPKLSQNQREMLLAAHASGKYTVVELAEMFKVSRPTVYRELAKVAA